MELKDCPFCGWHDIITFYSNDVNVWTCFCVQCEAEGPNRPSKELAEYNWNIRWQAN